MIETDPAPMLKVIDVVAVAPKLSITVTVAE